MQHHGLDVDTGWVEDCEPNAVNWKSENKTEPNLNTNVEMY